MRRLNIRNCYLSTGNKNTDVESTEFDISTALKRLPLVSMEEKIQL